MTATTRHALPLLSAGQAQKEVTHNEALLAIDRQLHLAVESRSMAVPPATPAAGAAYIVPAAAAGNWADRAGQIASWDGYGWIYTVPVRGCVAWIIDEAAFSVHDGGWSVSGWTANGLRISGRDVLSAPPVAIAAPAGGTTIDSQCRAVVEQLLTALRTQGIVL